MLSIKLTEILSSTPVLAVVGVEPKALSTLMNSYK